MRKVQPVTITEAGRDQSKAFLITELSADAAEWWAIRAFLALAKSGVDIPEDIQGLGMQGIAVLGLQALGKINPLDAKPLLDEMWQCLTIVPDPQKNPTFARQLFPDDIEEVATRLKLRMEVLQLHTGFSLGGAQSTSTSAPTATTSRTTRTYHRQ